MEDILSSIKRIIAEDSDQALSAPRQKRSVGLSPVAAPADHDRNDGEVLELTDAVPETLAPPVETTPSAPKTPEAALPVPPAETKPALASPRTIDASRSSLAALSALIVKPEVHGGDTLEGLVREMLKPMLAEWLDARLPEIVDTLVKQEIARITASR